MKTQAWRQDILKWYPKLHERAYFVPPVYMKRINYDSARIAEQHVAVPRPAVKATEKGTKEVSQSDELEDWEQQRILHCLKTFCERRPSAEVMLVLSQLQFSSYLGEPCFAATASSLPRPLDLKKENRDRGDFDVLIIHRHFGLLSAEIKSVGTLFTGRPETQADEDRVLVKRLQQATKQLHKSTTVLNHLTKDMHDRPRVTTNLMLPNVTRAQLQRVLRDDPRIRQELSACLGIPVTADPLELCLTSEQLSDRDQFWDVSDDVMKGLEGWWQSLMTSKGKDPAMTAELYEELVARFAGPATTVEVYCPSEVKGAHRVVRTEGEGVAETAARFMDLVLHQQQITILSSGEDLVYLTGPPGTGKTVILILQAERWLREGHEVHVISMYTESVAASAFIANSLKTKYPTMGHRIKFHAFAQGSDGDKDVTEILAARAEDGHLFVVVDEVDGSAFPKFCDKLFGSVRMLHLWAARIFFSFIPPYFTEFQLNVSLRCPGVVTREVQKSDFIHKYRQVRKYEENAFPHTDGPLIRELRHEGSGHPDDVMPVDCQTCGFLLASVLQELHVGENDKQTSSTDSPSPIQYRDVFLLCVAIIDGAGIISGLRQAGVPVTVLPYYQTNNALSQQVEAVATMAGPDHVTATDARCVAGLERKLVVWVQQSQSQTMQEHHDRLASFSRASGQLITITTSRDSENVLVQNEGSDKHVELGKVPGDQDPEDQFDEWLIQHLNQFVAGGTVEDIDVVIQIYVIHKNGDQHPIYFNLQNRGGCVGRGVWTGRNTSLSVTLEVEDLQRIIVGDERDAFQAFSQGRVKVHIVRHVDILLRVMQLWQAFRDALRDKQAEDSRASRQ